MSAVRIAPDPFGGDGHAPLAGRLRVLLLAMEYHAFARCMCALLEALGYEDARPAGRAEWKGYNRPGGGGYDLEAHLPSGLAPRRVVAQIKQFDGLNVHQRSVDELRGACLRAGASEALLVTTSAFSEVVRKAALSPDPAGGLVAPVRLIDGEELLALMVRHRIGVRERGQSGKRGLWRKLRPQTNALMNRSGMNRSERHGLPTGNLETTDLEIDEAFFQSLAGPIPATAPRREPPTLPGWRVTIQILPRSRSRARRRGQAEGEN